MNEFESCIADLEQEVYEEGSLKCSPELIDECIQKLEEEIGTSSRLLQIFFWHPSRVSKAQFLMYGVASLH